MSLMSTDSSPFSPGYTSRSELIEMFDGDAPFADELAAQFTVQSSAMMDAVRQALRSGDATGVSRAAHALKGSIGYFDPGEGQALAETIERIAPAEMARIPALLRALELRVDGLKQYLPQEFGGRGLLFRPPGTEAQRDAEQFG